MKRIIRNPSNDEIVIPNDLTTEGNFTASGEFQTNSFSVMSSVKTDLIPETTELKSLGTTLKKWLSSYIKNLYTGYLEITGQAYSIMPALLSPAINTQTLDWNLSNSFEIDLESVPIGGATPNILAISFSNPKRGASYAIKFIQGSVTKSITWPATVKWQDGIPGTLSASNNKEDVAVLFYDGLNYLASMGNNFA